MAEIFTAEHMVALLTLVTLEIVLGIDNVIFIAILSGKLPESQQARARTLGIGLAVITRVLLLLSITFIMRLTAPLINLFGNGLSGRDLILLIGGLFLIGKRRTWKQQAFYLQIGVFLSRIGITAVDFGNLGQGRRAGGAGSGPHRPLCGRHPTTKILPLIRSASCWIEGGRKPTAPTTHSWPSPSPWREPRLRNPAKINLIKNQD